MRCKIMVVTRHEVASKLTDYLHHRITQEKLVDWAEEVMMEGEFEQTDFEVLRDIVSRLGLADVKAFGLTWEDFETYLSRLGYSVRVQVLSGV
ncbi:MAG: hypothetical protein QME81_15365 [bacterium]|nr:hypothetical protein [bacterium]